MRVVSWNINKASQTNPVWRIITELNPDLALLQETISFPDDIKNSFDILFKKAVTKTGKPQRFGTAILVKGKILDELPLSSEYNWVNRELKLFSGNLVSCIAKPTGHYPINVISVHSPYWPIDNERLQGIDVTPIKLKLNPKVWVTEILWSALKNANQTRKEYWIVGGDFNSSETLDYLLNSGPRGNREILDRMNNLGFTECLRAFNGKLTPTFKNSLNGKIIHQIDHLFVTNSLYSLLQECFTGDSSLIFGEMISDHLPIIADFKNM